jgi:hypothetical protein
MNTYRFVLKDEGTINQGWWLKIDNLEDLQKYYDEVDSNRMSEGWESATNCREFCSIHDLKRTDPQPLKPHATTLGYFIGMHAANNSQSAMQAVIDIQTKKFQSQAEQILKGNNVYINRNGGWHFGKKDYTQWYDKDKLVFPNFKKNQIKIEQFPGGEHFYAYIDNMQVRDGDTLKWNTYEEAYKQALSIVNDK